MSNVTPLNPFNVAHEGLAFVNRYIWIADERRELVHHSTGDDTFISPVPWHADLVNRPAVDLQRPKPPRDERLGADFRTRARHAHPVEIADAFLGGELGTDLHEQFRLQLGQPRQPAAHRPR